MKNTKRPGWSRLDNAAKVFPALANKKDSRVFRFACQLTEPVQKKALQQAAEQALEEFPIFTNIIRHGMFWYYLEESGEMPIVHEEDQNVCSRLYDKNEHHLLIDISYYKCRINFEVFHAMADATGALMFLKTLVVNYLKIVHPVLAHEDLSLGIDSTFREKDSDSFSQYYNKEEKNSSMSFLGEKTVPIFHFHEPSTPDFFQQVTEAEVSTRQIIAAAKQANIHDFIMAAAAAGGAMCDFLYILKCFFHIFKLCFAVQRLFHIGIADALAFANQIVFQGSYSPKYLFKSPAKALPCRASSRAISCTVS